MDTVKDSASIDAQYADMDQELTEEDDDEEEVEPQLKYRRLGNDVIVVLKKHAASCVAVNSRFIVLGSHWGVVSIFDHLGNQNKNIKLTCHTTTVNQISIDQNGDHIASCSDEGRVVINGLYGHENDINITFDRPIKSIAIDPDFHKVAAGRRFITGDEKVILHERSFMSRLKPTILHDGDGTVRNIKWKGRFVAWASNSGVRVYDIIAHQVVSAIPRENSNLRPELYPCNLFWSDEHCLLIGWGESVMVCQVKKKLGPITSKQDPIYYVEITSKLNMDVYVAGIAWFEKNAVLLTYSHDSIEQIPVRGCSRRPQLRVISPHEEDFDDISNEVLAIKGFSENICNDYHLDCVMNEGLFVIVSPREVVIAEPRGADDHVTWLMEHNKFEEALSVVKKNDGKDIKLHVVSEIGKAYLNYLIQCGDYKTAASQSSSILGKDRLLWEEQVYKFASIHQLKAICPFLPRGDIRLSAAIYEMVLNEFLQTDYKKFHELIQEWPPTLYDIPTIINAVIDRLIYDPSDPILLQCLGDLYTYERQYEKSLAIYLRLGHKDAFDLIHKHGLYATMQESSLEMLMKLDSEQSIKIILDNLDQVPVNVVVKRLERLPHYLCQFLDRLFVKNPSLSQDYHGLQVKLYAEFQPQKLLSFLRNSNYYPLQEALDICQKFQMTQEMVFLLGRMGNTKQALRLIVEDLQDVDKAIEFCKEHDDKDLWEDLINSSLDKPQFITTLLNNIGTYVDPIIIIQRITKGMEIPGLRDSLVKILQDYSLQISLREGCKKILVSDCFSLFEKSQKQRKRGIAVHDDQVCPACNCKLLLGDIRQIGGVVIFNCRHAFHENCLMSPSSVCIVCHLQKRSPGSTFT
ncbi:Vacuolar protein sorting-associated protein 41 [Chamberlinius hualienensis]